MIKIKALLPRGRPPMHGATMRRVYVFLNTVHIARATKLGKGNLSAGVRKALETN